MYTKYVGLVITLTEGGYHIYICINEGKLSEVSSSLFEPKLGNLDSNNIFQGKNGWNGMRVLPLREVIYTL